ncbi:biopolymer transporter ExbD [Candidatus Kapabacteria bacterium]|nr:biopolymer transporter ExbD [Candidatus Kapabacteria bacterium]
MAGGGSLGGGGKTQRGKSGRKKKKRMGFHLDMTPLVDITFLLLTFFMFTTTMATPQVMNMSMPPEVEVEIQVKQSLLFTIFVDEDNRIFWFAEQDELEPLENLKDLRRIAAEQNLKPSARNELITAFKVHPDANYNLVVQILDQLNLAESQIVAGLAEDLDENGDPLKRKRKFTLAKLSEQDLEKIKEEAPMETSDEESEEAN